ncbi:MAG: hypothetical protein ACO28H_05665, partial [Ilumatobacteraceae bacterium]
MVLLSASLGSLFGLGFFFLVRPGALIKRIMQLRSRLEHGMVWLIRRAQTQHRADLAIVGYQASEMVSRKLTMMLVASVSALGLIVVLSALAVDVSMTLAIVILSSAAAVGFFLPDSQMRSKAKTRRQD